MLKKMAGNSLLSGSAVYLLSNLLAASIPFLLLPILTRHLSPSEYGQIAIFQTLLAGLGAFVGLSSQGAAGVKYYEQTHDKNELKFYIGNCFLVLIATAAVALLGCILFTDSLSEWLGLKASWLYLSVIVSVASFIVLMRMGQWQIRKQAKNFGVFQVSQSVINMIFSLLLVVYFHQGATGRLWVLCGVPLAFAVMALVLLNKDGLLGFAWRPNALREILAFGVPLIPHSAGLFLLSTVDRFFINAQLGLAQVGIYMVAVQLVSAMGLIFDAINNAYVPWLFERLSRNKFEEKKQIVSWTYKYFVALLGVVFLAFVIGPPVLVWIAGEKYSEAGDVVGWLAMGQAFNGMYLMVTNYIFYSKKTGWLSVATISSGLINIGLLMTLITVFGLKGAAVAFAISMAFKFLLTWLVSHRSYAMPWFDFKKLVQL